MINPLVSLIICVYNGEKYISQCLDSVLAQTYKNIEVIVIDDGSEDGSKDILSNYSRKDQRVKVFSQDNHGVSFSRNRGIRISQGDYFGIIDQDDIIHPEYVSYFVHLLLENDVDIATSLRVRVFAGDVPPHFDVNAEKFELWSGLKTAQAMLLYILEIGPWNKLIRRSLVVDKSIVFNEAFYCGEGFAFSVECFEAAPLVAVGLDPVYYYRVDNGSSGTSSFSIFKCDSALKAQDYIQEKNTEKTRKMRRILKFAKWKTASDYFVLISITNKKDEFPDKYKELYSFTKRNALIALTVPTTLKEKVRALLFWIGPKMTVHLLRRRINKRTGKKFVK